MRPETARRTYGASSAKGGGVGYVTGRDSVNLGRANVALRIDQRRPMVLDLAPVRDVDNTDLDDPVVMRRRQPRGLKIDDGVAGHCSPPQAIERIMPSMVVRRLTSSAMWQACTSGLTGRRGMESEEQFPPRALRTLH